MPSRRPANRIEASGSFRDSACATAIAGNKCPPVPPPEIKTRMPYPSHLLALGRNVHQYADRQQRDRKRGAAIADEREGNPGRRQRHGDGRDVDECLEGDPGGDAAGEQGPERIGRLECHPVAPIGEKPEEREHEGGAEQARLLSHDGKDEVRVREGQPLVFLNAVSKAEARETTRAEGDHRLDRLKPGVERIGDRKSTRLNSSHSQISYAVFCLKKSRPTSTALSG